MTKKAQTAAAINPGEAPKKDNTLKIVIVCLVIFVGLPMLGMGLVIALVFGITIKIARSNLANTNGIVRTVDNPDGEYIDSTTSSALRNIYDYTTGLSEGNNIDNGSQSYVNKMVTRNECRAVEDFVDEELGEDINICDDWGFRSFAYRSGDKRILELYGIVFDSGKYAKIVMNVDYSKYYNIAIDDADNGNIGPAKLLYYNKNETIPNLPEQKLDGDDYEYEGDDLEGDETNEAHQGVELNRV